MFYYLSFLRPPPQSVRIGSTILITPQIYNDLRTEPLEDPQDVFFSWSPGSPAQTLDMGTDASPSSSCTRPQKLTQWRHGNAYKQITVPPPPNARHGQSYQLILTVDDSKPPVIALAETRAGGTDLRHSYSGGRTNTPRHKGADLI